MALRARIDLNHGTIGEYLNGDHGVEQMLAGLAEPVLAAARESAPVATGAYRDGLHIEVDHTDRVAVRVVGSTDHDLVVEANTGNLARALDAAR